MTRLSQTTARERAKKLVTLAVHKDTPEKEATRAAVTACKYIRKYKLLEDPFAEIAENPAVQAAKAAYEAATNPAVKVVFDVVGDAIRKARRG